MIELPILNYDYDEEQFGFQEPEGMPAPTMSIGERFAVGTIAVGLLGVVLCGLAGFGRGGWLAIGASFGLLLVGGTALPWFRFHGTTPGIKHDGIMFRRVQRRGWIAWGLAVLITGFYVVFYWYKELQVAGMPALFEGVIRLIDPISFALRGAAADQYFFYGFLYTLAVFVFGVRMIMKYRHNRYHIVRTVSVSFFQLGVAFVLPGILRRLDQPEFYFSYFWPLQPKYLWPGDAGAIGGIIDKGGAIGVAMIGFGIFATFIATPILTYFFGKRWYCSWVCGCGGLAETLGDPWRQLSDKSDRAWRIERITIYSVLIAVVLVTALLWIDHSLSGGVFGSFSRIAYKTYGFVIVNMFAGVIGVGFYPLMGSRVWCRFGCPMAAILGILQRNISRFRITTNGDQCMSCGNCSTYCEMGIDIRAYAQRGENIVRASCVGCGVCAAVCPRGVLKLENGSSPRGNRTVSY